jgi:glutaredoxin
MMELVLYTTEGCHLCEDAHELLLSVADRQPLQLQLQEIGDDDELVARYGIRIPVVLFPDGSELGWPFTEEQLEQVILSKIS